MRVGERRGWQMYLVNEKAEYLNKKAEFTSIIDKDWVVIRLILKQYNGRVVVTDSDKRDKKSCLH